MEKRVNSVEGVNKDILPQKYSEGETKSDDADILGQVWDERVLMHFLNV